MTQSSAAQQLLDFIDASPTPFHCAETALNQLKSNGFLFLPEEDPWPEKLPERFCVVRNDSSLAAFIVPKKAHFSKGCLLAGAHTDSPCLRLKDHGSFTTHQYQQWGIEVYGSALHHTWADRDLGVAGRLIVRKTQGYSCILVKTSKPMVRIPNLAIHLNAGVNKGKPLNPQTQLSPITSLNLQGNLLSQLANEAQVALDDIVTSDLFLHTTEPSAFWGLENEFISAPRLDNQAMCESMLTGLQNSIDQDLEQIRGIVMFNHEECGSCSTQGAQSNFLESLLEKIALSLDTSRFDFHRGLSQSFFISADMAHALHPNFADRHDPNHYPLINKGPVIKSNANFNYATDARSVASFLDLCQAANVPCQTFINRSDLSCGSTIGPIIAAKLGIKTIDVGTPQWAMHSSRESAGSKDPEYINAVFSHYFKFGIN